MSAFSAAASALFAVTSSVNGGLVSISRPNVLGASFSTTATFGRSVLSVDDGNGGRIEVESQDFIVLVAQYVFNGVACTPAEGDQVTRVVGNVTQTFELTTPPYAPSGPTTVTYRLHSKIVNSQ